ncbi:MAG: peptide ABC transporter substrate-binding protein [Desulfobacterales bacterium]|nr:peptide ABC transporter substrate-binding protein [Desulfobacterales bacterium]
MIRKACALLLFTLVVFSLTPAAAEKVVTLGVYQEPETLNTYIGVQTVITYVHKPFAEYLIDVNEKGEYFPVLAAEVPTVENGGVSKDGLTITYKLRKGVKWSDGAPFTSTDVKFTWEAVVNPKNLVKSRSGYDLIESIETPDAHTAIVKYKEFYAPFLTRFAPVLPKHILGKLENINDAPYNRMPVGTGPFMVSEWASGNYIAMVKNPHYRDAAKVKIDKLFFKIIPSREVGIAQLQAGDIDGVWDLIEAQIPMMENNPALALCLSNSLTSERLILNHSTPTPPNNGNPDYPHPILGDLKVRQALDCGIDRKAIVDKLLFGKAKAGTTEIPHGWASNPDITPVAYDPAKAQKLLDEAGWKAGPDGIRQKEGKRLRLKITTTTGNKLREMVQQVLVDQMKKIGVEFYIENVPSAVLFGSWANDAPGHRPAPAVRGVFPLQEHPDRGQRRQRLQLHPPPRRRAGQGDRRRRQLHPHGRSGRRLPGGPAADLRDRAAHLSLSAADRARLPQQRDGLDPQRQRHHRRRRDLECRRLGQEVADTCAS